MATVIDVPGIGPILFSPVMAHSLERGDLMHGSQEVFRLTTAPYPTCDDQGEHYRAEAIAIADGYVTWLRMWRNESVLRAVGARAGGVL